MSNEVRTLVKSIQDLFPKFQVEESDILHPTTEFIVQFYNLMLNEFEDLIYSAVTNPLEESNHNESLRNPEEIFCELSKLSNKVKLKLSDIYEPNYVRTKSFLKIFLHFYSFSIELISEITPQFSEIIRRREDMSILLNEKHRLSEAISESAAEMANCIDENKCISEELSSVEQVYSEMQKRKQKKREIYERIEREIEELTQAIYLENLILRKEEKEQEDLTEQTVTEAEFNTLLETRDSLQNELKSLHDDHTTEDDSLSEQNKILKHHEDCRKALPDISELQSLENLRRSIKSLEISKDLQIKLNKLCDMKSKVQSRLEQEEQKYNEVSDEFRCLKTANDQENHELFEKKERLKQANSELGKQIRVKHHALETSIAESTEMLSNIKDERQKLISHICRKFNRIYSLQKNNYSKCHAALYSLKKQ